MTTKANVNNVNHSVKSSNKSIAMWIIGGIVLGVGGWAIYKEFIKPKKKIMNENLANSQSETDDIDNEEVLDEPDYVTRSGFIKELLNGINNDPLFGPEDIFILDYDDSDEDTIDTKIHELRDKFVSVNYVESTSSSDGYVEVNLKVDNILKKKYNKNDKSDNLINLVRTLVQDVKDIDDDFRRIRISIKSLCFHPKKDEDTEEVTISQLRDLKEVEGVRYINMRFFNCENEDGIDFIVRLLRLFHPEGGEADNELNLMPVIIVTENGYMTMPKRNSLAEAYLGIK